jgi:LVIVD repeat
MAWSPRRRQWRRGCRLLAAAVVALLLLPAASAASPRPDWRERLAIHKRLMPKLTAQQAVTEQEGVSDHFKLLGHHELRGPTNGDVWFYDHGGKVGKYAYVGTWSDPCSGVGVKIVDVNHPTHPRLVATTPTWPGVSHEDVVVRRIGGRDILGVGIQICGEEAEAGGLALFDVTNPRQPRRLSFLPTPAGGVHELDLVVRPGGRALALLAVPFAEFENVYFGADNGGDFRIVDITDPARPVPLADWGVIADSHLRNFAGNDEVSSPYQGLGYFAAHFAHSARAADRGRTAYVSYWDSGVLKFDRYPAARGWSAAPPMGSAPTVTRTP